MTTVPHKVTISHRGANFEIGTGRDYYGIWAVSGPRANPIAQWPQTTEGWYDAWARFVAIESPSTIAVVEGERRAPSVTARALRVELTLASSLLVASVVVGLVGLFPNYLDAASLASQPAELVPHVLYLAAWSLAALLLAFGRTPARVGALLAAGTTVGTLGLFLGDAGTAISSGAHVMGAGLVLGLVGWLLAAAGTVAAALHLHSDHVPAEQRPQRLRGAIPFVLVALGTAIAFAPSWDRFVLTSSTGSTTLTAGNAFSNPAPVIAGNVAVMVLVVAVAAIAALWRPLALGAALLAGAIVPLVGQAVSAVIQIGEAAPPSEFGISAAHAAQINLQISSGLTGAFYFYCLFLAALIGLTAGMLVTVRLRPLDEHRRVAAESHAEPPADTGF